MKETQHTQHLIRKMMQDKMTPEERDSLLALPDVHAHLSDQWDHAADYASREVKNPDRLRNAVLERISGKPVKQYLRFYKIYSLAATILIVLAVAGLTGYYLLAAPGGSVYVVNTGIQNFETVYLPDGSSVNLGPGSTLTYPEHFRGRKRAVKLNGQGFFDVAKNPGRPFIVSTLNLTVEALGTAFEIFCYDTDDTAEVILLNGKIKVGLSDSDTQNELFYLVNPDEKLVINKTLNEVKKWKVNAGKYSAWRLQNTIRFDNDKLSMILPRLKQWYGREISCNPEIADKYRFTFKVRDESLEKILFMLSESTPLTWQQTENESYIRQSE